MSSNEGLGTLLDREAFRDLGYAEADVNSPRTEWLEAARPSRARTSAPVPRRGMLPVAIVPPGILKAICKDVAPGQVGEDTSERYQTQLRQLLAFSVPIGDVPHSQCFFAEGMSRAGAGYTASVFLRAARGKPVCRTHHDRLPSAFRKMFGMPPARAWIVPFVKALRSSALARLNWDRRLAPLDEGQRAAFVEPPPLLEQATVVIDETRARMSKWPAGVDLPEWIEPRLTACLMKRFGFGHQGGGGASRVVAEKNLVVLLAKPQLLIHDLKKAPQGARRWLATIERLTQELARDKRDEQERQLGQIPPGSGARHQPEFLLAKGSSRVAAGLVAQVLLRASRGESISQAQHESLDCIFEKMFEIPVESAWILPFVETLRDAALLRRDWASLVAQLEEGQRSLCAVPPTPLDHAANVLGQTHEKMNAWPCDGNLPDWIDSEVTAYLMTRVALSSRGGGPRRAISERTMVALLAKPERLIQDLKKSTDGALRWGATIEQIEQDLAGRSRMDLHGSGMPGQGGRHPVGDDRIPAVGM